MDHKPRILLTGAGGYIGQVLTPVLEAANFDVLGLDNWANSKIKPHILTCDIRDEKDLMQAFRHVPFDAVVHLAAETNIRSADKILIETNIHGTHNLIECCRATDVKRVVFASSAAVYGEPSKLPLTEGSPLNPTSEYGVSKQIGEWSLIGHASAHNISAVNLRIFNPIGGDTPKGSSITSQILQHINRRESLMIYGNGDQRRDFIHVLDVCDAIHKAVDWTETHKGSLTANICTGEYYTINHLLRTFEEVTGRVLAPEYLAANSEDMLEVWGKADAAKTHLEWSPTRTLEEAIRSAYESTK